MVWTRALLVVTMLAIGAAVSVHLGQDTDWDLLNYHIRDPYTVLNGRLLLDIAPASLQSYFNPTLDIPFYWLATGPLSRHPAVLAAVMGLPFGALILAALGVASRLFARGRTRWPFAGLATAAAVGGAATMSQVGTAFNEVPIAALTLFGLWAGLPGVEAGFPARRLFGAGLLFGAAAGLKLTALLHAPAFCVALFFFLPFRRWVRGAAAFSAGWAATFAVFAGWWMWRMFEAFASPVFPMFNPVFRSPWVPPASLYDLRFLPKTALQWMFYPFMWLTSQQPVNAELAYRDPRLSMFLVAAVFFLLALLARSVRSRAAAGPAFPPSFTAQQRFVLAYTLLAYALWLYSFAIMRYGIVLEVAGTLSTAVVLVAASGCLPARAREPLAVGLVAGLAVFYAAWTRVPDYGRIAFGDRVFAVDMDWTPPDTLFVAETGPTAYVTAFVPPDRHARTVGFGLLNQLVNGWRLEDEAKALVDAHRGPIIVLVPGPSDPMTDSLPMLGLSSQLGPCRRVASNLDDSRVRACEARRL